ncbi:hypothetical protein HK096_008855 [Nowakowskiella sp. JEL0078]|nr:hypothetical protein HK096_008855 [Nowakowskiella sp. JEL0078]
MSTHSLWKQWPHANARTISPSSYSQTQIAQILESEDSESSSSGISGGDMNDDRNERVEDLELAVLCCRLSFDCPMVEVLALSDGDIAGLRFNNEGERKVLVLPLSELELLERRNERLRAEANVANLPVARFDNTELSASSCTRMASAREAASDVVVSLTERERLTLVAVGATPSGISLCFNIRRSLEDRRGTEYERPTCFTSRRLVFGFDSTGKSDFGSILDEGDFPVTTGTGGIEALYSKVLRVSNSLSVIPIWGGWSFWVKIISGGV